MPPLSPLCLAAAIIAIATPVAAAQVNDVCREFGSAEVIFVGRVKSEPITRRISGDQEIEKARVASDAAERDLKAFEALKMPPQIGGGRHLELAIRAVKASDEYSRIRAMHPPPVDLSLTPILVEVPFRGVTTAELFMMNRVQPALDPARSYLFYAVRQMGPLAPDVIFAGQPKDVESAEAELRYLHDAVANNDGTLMFGTLKMEDPDDQRRLTPLGGVVLRVSLDDQRIEISTNADGSFSLPGLPPGMLKIEPVLPDHLTLPPQSTGGQTRGGCLEVHMRATFNGRIRGRVVLDSGAPFRGIVDLLRDGHTRHLPNSTALTNDRGEFAFSAVPPGNYLLGINALRQPSSGAPFRPTYFPGTTDRSLATAVVVGPGTEHVELEWAVDSRLREGSIDVSFDTHGQAQKEMGVCVTMFDSDNRNTGGVGYERRSPERVIVKVVEGVRYRLVAWARTSSGFAESEMFDIIGAPGHRAITLPMTSVSDRATGSRCASHSAKPFSP